MDSTAHALVILHPGRSTALVRITAPGVLLWRRYPLPTPLTQEDIQAMVQTAARHLVPQGGRVRLSYQLPLGLR